MRARTIVAACAALVAPVFVSALVLSTSPERPKGLLENLTVSQASTPRDHHGTFNTFNQHVREWLQPRLAAFLQGHGSLAAMAYTIPAIRAGGIEISKPILVSTLPEVTLESGRLVVPQSAPAGAGDPANARIKDEGKIEVEEVVLKTPKITIRLPRGSTVQTSVLGLPEVLGPLASALQNFKFQRLRIDNGEVEIHYPKRAPEIMSGVSASITVTENARATARGTMVYRGATLAFDFQVSSAVNKEETVLVPVICKVKSKLFTAMFDGALKFVDGLTAVGTMDLETPELSSTLRWLGHSNLSIQEIGAFKAKGPMIWRNGTLEFSQSDFALDTNSARGNLALNFSGKTPSMDGTLAIKRLDLTPYLVDFMRPEQSASRSLLSIFKSDEQEVPTANAADASNNAVEMLDGVLRRFTQLSANGGSTDAPQPDTKYTLPVLQQFNADLRMSIAEVAIANLVTGPSAVTLALRNGKLLADVAEMQVHEGAVSGQIELETRLFERPKFALRSTLDNINLGTLLGSFLKKAPVEGKAHVDIDIHSEGRTVKDMVASVSGDARIRIPEGGRADIDIMRIISRARRSPVKGWGSEVKGETRFDKLNARIKVTKGSATASNAEILIGRKTLLANGYARLPDEELGVRLLINNKKPQPALPFPEARRPTDESITVVGSWHSPTIAFEAAGPGPFLPMADPKLKAAQPKPNAN